MVNKMLSRKILFSASAALLGLSLAAAPFGLQPDGQALGAKSVYAKAGGGPGGGGNSGGNGNAGGNGNGNGSGNGGAASAGAAGHGKSGNAPGHGAQNPGKGHASGHGVSSGKSAVGHNSKAASMARARSGVKTAVGRSIAKAIGKPAKTTGFKHSISPALLGSLNAAHANEMALANANEKSRVGQIANYKGAMETLSNPNATDREIAEAMEQAAQSLAKAANKKTSPAVVGAVNDLVGVEVNNNTEAAISDRTNEIKGL
jgi:hypothetical protein